MSTEQPNARTPAGQAFTNLVVETFRFNGRLLAAGDRLTKEFGMTSALWQVLGAIDEQPLTLAQIGRNMGLTRQSVRRSSILLAKKGFITFEENPDHKRAKLVVLTEEGRSSLDRVMDAQVIWSNTIADGLDAEDLQAAVRIMTELHRRL